jgi:hypothetical protein
MNHLEDLLVNNLLGFLITATSTVLAGIYLARRDRKSLPMLTPRHVLTGANVVYLFLGGYYYFMLAQFYATVVVFVPLAKTIPAPTGELWSVLQTPSFGILTSSTSNLLMLLAAPLFPVAFSSCAITTCWFLVRQAPGRSSQVPALGYRALGAALTSQVFLAVFMILHPLLRFLDAVGV